MSDILADFCRDVLQRTGRKGLLDAGRKIAQREKELLAWAGDVGGVEKAQQALEDDETHLENELRQKTEGYRIQLEILDSLGKVGLAGSQLTGIQFRKSNDEREHLARNLATAITQMKNDDFESDVEEMNQLVRNIATPIQLSAEIDSILKNVHDDYIKSFRKMIGQLRSALYGYRHVKAKIFIVPKIIYLVFTLAILAIGGCFLGEQFMGLPLKLGLAIAVWALQEFVITPFSERKLRQFKQKSLEDFIMRLSRIKIWATFLDADIEHRLREGEELMRKNLSGEGGKAKPDSASDR